MTLRRVAFVLVLLAVACGDDGGSATSQDASSSSGSTSTTTSGTTTAATTTTAGTTTAATTTTTTTTTDASSGGASCNGDNVCLSPIPDDWDGPFVVARGSTDDPPFECPAPFDAATDEVFDSLNGGTHACGCSCLLFDARCSGPATLRY